MNIIVCGGRGYTNRTLVHDVLNSIKDSPPMNTIRIATGECPTGADSLAKEWATCSHYKQSYTGFPANWKKHGPAAGPIRNSQMLEEFKPNLVVAFPGGKGTEDMITKARAAGVTVLLVGKSYPLLW